MAKKETVYNFVAQRISAIKNMKDDGRRKALLAELRRGVGRQPGELPLLWGVLLQDMPTEIQGKGLDLSPGEWAVYTALTLYAYHQQGKDPATESMNKPGQNIGYAAALLVKDPDDMASVQGRFNRFALSDDMSQAVIHLRSLISLLRRDGIGLDYPALANHLYLYQFQDAMANVRLQWGRDFYRCLNTHDKEENKNE